MLRVCKLKFTKCLIMKLHVNFRQKKLFFLLPTLKSCILIELRMQLFVCVLCTYAFVDIKIAYAASCTLISHK